MINGLNIITYGQKETMVMTLLDLLELLYTCTDTQQLVLSLIITPALHLQ